jgi:glyoxylase-like metal-dependent hydrolase (beta-lactamase superfamily II)
MRYFLVITVVVAASLAAQTVPAGDGGFEVRRLSDRVIVVSGGPINNSTFALAASDGLIVIDTNYSQSLASEIRSIIEREFGRSDFAYVINTSHSGNHFGGNQVFGDAVIIAHDNAPAGMRRYAEKSATAAERLDEHASSMEERSRALDAGAEEAADLMRRAGGFRGVAADLRGGWKPTLPTMTFRDRMTLSLGGLTLEMHSLPGLHLDSDVIIQVPEEGLLLTGDIFSEEWLPVILTDVEPDVPAWIATIDALLDGHCEVKHIFPGHSHDSISTEMLVHQRNYLEALWLGVKQGLAEGQTLADAQKKLDLETGFPELSGVRYPENYPDLHRRNVELIWNHLSGRPD